MVSNTRAPGATTQPIDVAPAGQADASELAQDTYERGARYLRDGLDRYPEAGRSISEGEQAVSRPVEQHPLTAILLAGAVGYLLAYVIHGSRDRRPR